MSGAAGATGGDAGAGAAGAAGAPPAGTPPAGAPPAAATDWTSGFSDEAKGFIQNKGFKGPADLLESYRNMEKLMGAPKERILRLPEKDDDPAWNDIQARLGKPESPDKYSFKVDPAVADEQFDKWAREAFHKAGFTDKQAAKFMEEFSGYAKARQATQLESIKTKLDTEATQLKQEWGAAHDQNTNLAKRAAQELGISGEQIDQLEKVMGFAGVMKLFHSIGTKVGEAAFVSGSGGGGNGFAALTPQAALNRIAALRGDPGFVEKYVNGDAAARQEMEMLHRYAYPG